MKTLASASRAWRKQLQMRTPFFERGCHFKRSYSVNSLRVNIFCKYYLLIVNCIEIFEQDLVFFFFFECLVQINKSTHQNRVVTSIER